MLLIVDAIEEAVRLTPMLKRAGYQVAFANTMLEAALRLSEQGGLRRAVIGLREDWITVLPVIPPDAHPASDEAVPHRETIASGIEFDPARQAIVIGESVRALTTIEARLLRALLDHPNRPLNRAQLLDRVWGFDYHGQNREVDVYIRYLRRKIEPEPTRPCIIVTVRGLGYMYKPGAGQ